jgi:hypothetical protein
MKKRIPILLLCIASQFAASAGTFTEYHTVTCGSMLQLGRVGYPTWNQAVVIQAPAHGEAIVQTINFVDSLFYQSAGNYSGVDTFIVACAHATQITCDTGIYIVQTTCGINATADAASMLQLVAYPNPATHAIFLKSESPIAEARLYSLQGKTMLVRRWPDGVLEAELPLGDVPSGTYGLKIKCLAGVVFRKISVVKMTD